MFLVLLFINYSLNIIFSYFGRILFFKPTFLGKFKSFLLTTADVYKDKYFWRFSLLIFYYKMLYSY